MTRVRRGFPSWTFEGRLQPPNAQESNAGAAQWFSRIKVIWALDTVRGGWPWTCRSALAILTIPPGLLSSRRPEGCRRPGRRLTSQLGKRPTHTVVSLRMNHAEFQLQGLGDPRLAVHATSALPAWLWSTDGTRILWANPVGARMFGAANNAMLAQKVFGPADPHRRQIARLAGRLPANGAIRMERLQGFGAAPGGLATCGCSRLDFPDGSHGILIAAGNTSGRIMPLVERLQRLVDGIGRPIAAFTRDGMLVSASDAARPLLGFRNLAEAGLDEARDAALKQGRAETCVGIGHMVLHVSAAAQILP